MRHRPFGKWVNYATELSNYEEALSELAARLPDHSKAIEKLRSTTHKLRTAVGNDAGKPPRGSFARSRRTCERSRAPSAPSTRTRRQSSPAPARATLRRSG